MPQKLFFWVLAAVGLPALVQGQSVSTQASLAPFSTVARTQEAAPAVPPAAVADPNRKWLRWEDVQASVQKHYPPLLAVLQDRIIADGDVTLAEGRFDLNLKGNYDGDFLGFYRNDVVSAGVTQATSFQGMSWFAGYQIGRGSYPSYEGKLQTDTGGEYKIGARLPVFRDRAIDSRRAELQKALIGRRVADLGIDQQRLLITQLAMRRYYDWLAAGQRYQAASDVLRVAEQRDQQLKDASDLGQIPRIDVTDNQRAILTRRAQVVEALRGLELTSIELSLFLRDDRGDPRLVSPDELPPAFPELKEFDAKRLQEDIELAIRRRPEITRFAAQRDQVEVDRRLAENQLMPNIDVAMSYTRQLGERIVRRGPDDLIASLIFDLPAQRRAARGREISTLARIEQFDQRERFARDQVTAEVRDAYSALRAAFQRAQVLKQEVQVARELEDAERVRFKLGDGTLFLVNLREQSTFDTVIREVSAVNEYFRALALYEFAIAEALKK
jgi:outer membrane protein TolC